VTRTASQPAAPAKVRITDSTLRDGSHAMAHRFTEEQVRGVVHALDAAGYVGGQEDMIIDIALQLAAERERAATPAAAS
jgi:hypothetical protein